MFSPRVIRNTETATVDAFELSDLYGDIAKKKAIAAGKRPDFSISSTDLTKFQDAPTSKRIYTTILNRDVEVLPKIPESSKRRPLKSAKAPVAKISSDEASIRSHTSYASSISSTKSSFSGLKGNAKFAMTIFFIFGLIGGGLAFHFTRPTAQK